MSSNKIIESLVVEVSTDSLNPVLNFNAAVEYEKLNQTASAVGFYLRAVEYGYETDPLVAYTSLLRISICMDGQKDRNWTVSNTILQAITFLPGRPEAYFLMSKFYEQAAQWQESYTFAQLGLLYSEQAMLELPVDVSYIGTNGLLFQKAVAGWWIGRKDESAELLKYLTTVPLPEVYKNAVLNNLNSVINNVQ
jgi:hypothetical protein